VTTMQLSFWDPFAPIAVNDDADLDVDRADREAAAQLAAEIAHAHLPDPCRCDRAINVLGGCLKCGHAVVA
jgi:hypothetical protein